MDDDSRTPGRIRATAAGWDRRLAFLGTLAFFGVILALAAPNLAGCVYVADDLGQMHLPLRQFYARQLAAGERFDWMPQLCSGLYLTGEGQAGTYHPFHWLLYGTLPLATAFSVELLASYPLAFLGMVFFLRRRLGSTAAAVFGGLAFTSGGFNLLHFVHPNAVAVVAHLPWLLWAIDVSMTTQHGWTQAAAVAGIAVLTASQLLLGYPQYVWFSLAAEGAFVAFVTLEQAKANGRKPRAITGGGRWPRVAIGVLLGVVLGGVQLLPTIESLAESARRSAGGAFALWGSLHPWNLIQLVAPYWSATRVVGQNTHELAIYLGAAPLAVACWTLTNTSRLGRRRALVWASCGGGVLALLLAFGGEGPLAWPLAHLPVLSCFRFPCRYIVLVQLAVAVIAAVGFGQLARRCELSAVRGRLHGRVRRAQCSAARAAQATRSNPIPPAQATRVVLNGLVLCSLAVALAGLLLRTRLPLASVGAILGGAALVPFAVWLVAQAAAGRRAALAGLLIFTAADLGAYGISQLWQTPPLTIDAFVRAQHVPPGDDRSRWVGEFVRFDQPGLRQGDALLLAGWPRADGYVGLEPRRRLPLATVPALQMAGVRWVVASEANCRIARLMPHGEQWLEVPAPPPRARFVTDARVSEDAAADAERIDVSTTALVEHPLPLTGEAAGEARVVVDMPGRIAVQTQLAAGDRQLLVLTEAFHPGWRAAIDGAAVAPQRVNGDFLGCVVGAGTHRVAFEFEPPSLALGWRQSLLGLALVCIIPLAYARQPNFQGSHS